MILISFFLVYIDGPGVLFILSSDSGSVGCVILSMDVEYKPESAQARDRGTLRVTEVSVALRPHSRRRAFRVSIKYSKEP